MITLNSTLRPDYMGAMQLSHYFAQAGLRSALGGRTPFLPQHFQSIQATVRWRSELHSNGERMWTWWWGYLTGISVTSVTSPL